MQILGIIPPRNPFGKKRFSSPPFSPFLIFFLLVFLNFYILISILFFTDLLFIYEREELQFCNN